jgi:cell division protein FtsI (penicillin-binding protein 3)
VDSKGDVLFLNSPNVVRRVISTPTARKMNSILRGVVREGGTGFRADVEGFDVAGKTGTSQKADLVNGGYSKKERLASFIGFVPADDPRLVVLVLIDEPEVNVYGGVVAAPVFRDIAQGTLRHLGVVPESSGIDWLPAVEKNPSLREEGGDRGRGGDLPKTSGAPDFFGLSLREAVLKARALDLHVVIRGSGYVVKQSPSPGANWRGGDTLSLILRG